MTSYVLLGIAIATEILATALLKKTDGFTVPLMSLICLAIYVVSHTTFAKSLTNPDLNLGIAYALWCGIGIVATALISRFAYGEAISAPALVGMGLILIGCVLMNVFG